MVPDLSMEFVHVPADFSSTDYVLLFVPRVLPESETNAKDVNLHVSSAQAHQHSALTVWTLSLSSEALDDVIKAQPATMVKCKAKTEDARESAVKTYSS